MGYCGKPYLAVLTNWKENNVNKNYLFVEANGQLDVF